MSSSRVPMANIFESPSLCVWFARRSLTHPKMEPKSSVITSRARSLTAPLVSTKAAWTYLNIETTLAPDGSVRNKAYTPHLHRTLTLFLLRSTLILSFHLHISPCKGLKCWQSFMWSDCVVVVLCSEPRWLGTCISSASRVQTGVPKVPQTLHSLRHWPVQRQTNYVLKSVPLWWCVTLCLSDRTL